MKKNGYTTIELVVLIGIFSVAYFIGVGVVSKDFKGNYKEELYEQKIEAIEKQAAIYAKGTEDLFSEDKDSVYLTIGELAEVNAIISNKEGIVVDPRNESKNLNDLRVKITNKNDKVTAQVLA